ncbi:MAG: ATP-binding protein [Kofleriaceae bacterium]
MHPLLARQLRKWRLPDTPEVTALVAAIDAAYLAGDAEREQLERSLHLVSEELYERNRRLELELDQRKRLEVELQHAEKLRAVGQLAAGVAHEINTPVQFVGDSLVFLQEAMTELAPVLEAARTGTACPISGLDLEYLQTEIPRAVVRCREGSERVAKIVRALKGFAHRDTAEQVSSDIHAAIENTLVVVANELKYVADVVLDLSGTREVCCNIGEIQQVLLNLLVNAGHAITERVGISNERGTIRVATHDDGADLVLAISDTGSGIPPHVMAKIFEPFFTTKPVGKGTGQGLAIVHTMIVDHHHGKISVDSVVGEGTTFTVRIPVTGRSDRVQTARAVAG